MRKQLFLLFPIPISILLLPDSYFLICLPNLRLFSIYGFLYTISYFQICLITRFTAFSISESLPDRPLGPEDPFIDFLIYGFYWLPIRKRILISEYTAFPISECLSQRCLGTLPILTDLRLYGFSYFRVPMTETAMPTAYIYCFSRTNWFKSNKQRTKAITTAIVVCDSAFPARFPNRHITRTIAQHRTHSIQNPMRTSLIRFERIWLLVRARSPFFAYTVSINSPGVTLSLSGAQGAHICRVWMVTDQHLTIVTTTRGIYCNQQALVYIWAPVVCRLHSTAP